MVHGQITISSFLILPIHQLLDEIREKNSGSSKIGTTGRGFGPAYEDKVGRRGLRVCDLLDRDHFNKKLKSLYDFHNIWLSALGETKQNHEKDFQKLWKIGQLIIPFIKASWLTINEYKSSFSNILFEGANSSIIINITGFLLFILLTKFILDEFN